MPHLILTGADGYIGGRLLALARTDGWDVTVLARRGAGPGRLAWRLGEALPGAAAPADALVHLAHDWTNPKAGGEEAGLNLSGTRALLESARAAGVGRFVFVSSQSARADAANVYGRAKWRIEQELAGAREVAARVGLVYGGPRRAMYGLLCRLTGLSPVLPMIDPWRTVQPIHLDEVCRGLLALARGGPGGWVGLAGPAEVPFGEVLKIFARELHGRRLRILPVPLRLALLACDASAAVPFGPTVDRERVLGLAGTRPMPCAAHLAALGLSVRPLAAGLRGEAAGRKAVLREGRLALRYVLGARPGAALLRRYARAVAAAGEGPVPLPPSLRLMEPVAGGGPLARRLALATALAEASPEGAAVLGRVRPVRLVGALALEAALLPLRLLLGSRR